MKPEPFSPCCQQTTALYKGEVRDGVVIPCIWCRREIVFREGTWEQREEEKADLCPTQGASYSVTQKSSAMRAIGKRGLGSIGTTLLIVGLSISARGQSPNIPVAPFSNLNGLTQIKGSIVCVECSVAEVEKDHAASGHLYELENSRRHSKAVLRVDEVDDAARWSSITIGHRLQVRTAAAVWQQLTAEDNLFREVQITGLLSSDRTLDVTSVTASGERPSKRSLVGTEE